MHKAMWWISAAAVLACGAEQEAGDTDAAMTANTMMDADTVMLAAKNNSGIAGTVVLTEMGDSITVTVMLTGATAGASYPAHIHNGMCAAPGGVAAPLASVTIGDNGSGTAMTRVAARVIEGEHENDMDEGEEHEDEDDMDESEAAMVVQVHLPGGQPAACAQVAGT